MGRKPQFTNKDFLEAAQDLLSEKGLSGVTITGIAKHINAPVGSVYHRFKSREILLAELWLTLIESFQSGFIKSLKIDSVEQAALYTLKWVRKNTHQAKVFLLYRREELITGQWPGSMRERASRLAKELDDAMQLFIKELYDKPNKEAKARVFFALIQAPASIVRPYLENDVNPPRFLDEIIRQTCLSVLKTG